MSRIFPKEEVAVKMIRTRDLPSLGIAGSKEERRENNNFRFVSSYLFPRVTLQGSDKNVQFFENIRNGIAAKCRSAVLRELAAKQ